MTIREWERMWDEVSQAETTEEITFSDVNGQHDATVGVDGEFWRVVCVQAYGAGLPPEAARRLAHAILRAADRAEREDKKMAELRGAYAEVTDERL